MKKLKMLWGGVMVFTLILGLTGAPTPAHAATAPALGAASTYAVYGDAGVTNDLSATTHIWGNVGHNGLGATNLSDATQVDGVIDVGAGVAAAASTAYDALATWGPDGALDLDGGGSVTPGVYTVGATALNGTLTLDGAGVYIFRSSSSIATSGAAVMNLINGATACNVFWQIPTSMTIGANSVIEGTIITQTGLISMASGASLKGRALAKTQVTMIANQITEPTCATATTTSSTSNNNTITVVKQVINDNGGVATFSDFPLFVNGNPVTSGQSVSLAPGMYSVTETNLPGYTTTFSGNCNVSGQINHGGVGTHNDLCTVVNDDIGAAVVIVPPLIDVVKVPNPLALPAGPGLVNYTYTARNIGTVPMTNVTMLGDTCSPIIFDSGDTNNDTKLDVNETWVYRCAKTLTQTTTNIVTATGYANGLNAIDVATATVVVGVPIVPPLIHITKVPNPLTLPNGAGMVTYTKKVTNPGTVALSNVKVTDDKCSPIKYISGDTNNDAKLDPTETWTYTCQTKLTKTTTNTAVATGSANGLIATDFALATVVVAAVIPTLPNTGFMGDNSFIMWITGSISILSAVALLVIMARKRVS